MAVPLFNAAWLVLVVGHTMCRVCLSWSTSSRQILHRHMSHLFLFFGCGQFGESVFLLMPSLYVVMTTSVSPSRQRLDLWVLSLILSVRFLVSDPLSPVFLVPHLQLVISGSSQCGLWHMIPHGDKA